MRETVYDVVVLGGGPGGYTAALYAARAGLRVVVLEQLAPGGQMAATGIIENYPGFDEGIDGFTLGEKMRRGAERFGAETVLAQVLHVQLRGTVKQVETSAGSYRGRTVVVATGAQPRPLGVAREEELRGRGVTYCATCDGMLYRGKEVLVVGGGNSAVADALVLAKLCRSVTLIHRRDTLRAPKTAVTALEAAGVQILWNHVVEALLGQNQLEGVRLRDVRTGETCEQACEGLFIAAGRVPDTLLFREELEVDEQGYLCADESTRTNLPGVFAVGDVRQKPLRQIVTAVADGAVASQQIEAYLAEVDVG